MDHADQLVGLGYENRGTCKMRFRKTVQGSEGRQVEGDVEVPALASGEWDLQVQPLHTRGFACAAHGSCDLFTALGPRLPNAFIWSSIDLHIPSKSMPTCICSKQLLKLANAAAGDLPSGKQHDSPVKC